MADGRKQWNWLSQLFCPHTSRTWKTVPITETLSRTEGGCNNCGKAQALTSAGAFCLSVFNVSRKRPVAALFVMVFRADTGV